MPRATRLPATMSGTTHFVEAESARVRRLVAARGYGRTRLLLDVSAGVLDAARDCGRVFSKTHARVMARLEEIETEAKGVT